MLADTRFYITGGTLPGCAASYVSRQADSALFEGLLAGDFCYVLDTRQMGKSSLMVRTAARLREAGATVVVLDLTGLGQNLTVEQWYDGLLNLVGRQLGLEDELDAFWLGQQRIGPLQRWMRALREIVLSHCRGPLVIFVDEIDAVRSLPFSTDEFFAGIRECYNLRAQDPDLKRLTFCLLGVATPADLIRDTGTTPFNIGRRIELEDFTAEEALPLAKGLLRGNGATGEADNKARTLLRRVLFWTGGHPCMTQRLCQAAAESGACSPRAVDRLCEELFLSKQAQERDDNMLFVRDRMLKSPCDLASLLDLYRQVHSGKRVPQEELNPLVDVLSLAGIVRSEGIHLRVRNRIYGRVFNRRWIRDHMPDAELRRQQAAYRRGVLRATVVAVSVVLILAALLLTAIAYAQKAEHSRREADTRTREARSLAASLQAALHDKETALTRLRAAVEAEMQERQHATHEAVRARKAEGTAQTRQRQAVAAQQLAEAQKAEALRQKRNAETKTQESRQRLAHLHNATGMRLAEEGNPMAALPWFVEALRLDAGNLERQKMDRLRIGTTIAACPQCVRIWFHNGPVHDAEFSPDGKLVVTASSDHTARVWNVATGKPVTPPLKHSGEVWHAAFSPDGRRIVTASGTVGGTEGEARIWDVQTGRLVCPPLKHAGRVNQAVFSPEGRRVVTASDDKTARVWDAATGQPITPALKHSEPVVRASFSPDGRHILTMKFSRRTKDRAEFTEGGAYLWDATSGQPASETVQTSDTLGDFAELSPDGRRILTAGNFLPYPSNAVVLDAATGVPISQVPAIATTLCAAFSPGGRRVVSGGLGGTAFVWDAKTGLMTSKTMQHKGNVISTAFSPDGRQVLTVSNDGTARVWDASTGWPMTPMMPHSNSVSSAVFSPNGRYVLTASADSTVRLWEIPPPLTVGLAPFELAPPQGTRILPTQSSPSLPITFSADGHAITTIDRGQTIQVISTVTGQPIARPIPLKGPIRQAAFALHGRLAVTADADGKARVWDTAAGKAITPTLLTPEVNRVAFSPDGRHIATASGDHRVRVWEAKTGKPLTPPLLHESEVAQLVFSPDGRCLCTVTANDTVRFWNARSGKPITPPYIWKYAGRLAPVFAPDSPEGRRILALCEDNAVCVYDRDTGKPVSPALRHKGSIWSAAFSPDGRRIATASYDYTARVWDAHTGQPVTPPLPHTDRVYNVGFSPDGRLLATAGQNQARVWDIATGEPVTPPILEAGEGVEFSPDGRKILLTGDNGKTDMLLNLQEDRRSVTDLLTTAQLLSGHRLEAAGMMPTDPRLLRCAWKAFQTKNHSSAVVTKVDMFARYTAVVNEFSQASDWAGARSYLDKLIALKPTDGALRYQSGRVYGELGEWDKAAADFSQALTPNDKDPTSVYCLALTRLASGDRAGYRSACAQILERFGRSSDAETAYWAAWACILAPDAVTDAMQPVRLAQKLVASSPKDARLLHAWGITLYRAGQFDAAVQRLNEAAAAGPPPRSSPAYTLFFLAMAHQRLGHTEEARKRLREAIQLAEQERKASTPPLWNRRLTLDLLQREAEALIKPGGP